jgi:growth arrest-specific protein 8
VYKQKVKHLLYEHHNNIATLKADGELALKLCEDDHRRELGEAASTLRAHQQSAKEQVPNNVMS